MYTEELTPKNVKEKCERHADKTPHLYNVLSPPALWFNIGMHFSRRGSDVTQLHIMGHYGFPFIS